MKYEKYLAVIIILSVLVYGFANYMSHKARREKQVTDSKKTQKVYKNRELSQENIVNYIIFVIKNGSNRFNFPGGSMEANYVPPEKAKDVACYVYELSGRKCKEKYNKDAALYFSSNCAGCHGNDAKGLHGRYPDLTKKVLLGLKREF